MEAGQKCSKIKGEKTKQHSSHHRKIGAYLLDIADTARGDEFDNTQDLRVCGFVLVCLCLSSGVGACRAAYCCVRDWRNVQTCSCSEDAHVFGVDIEVAQR